MFVNLTPHTITLVTPSGENIIIAPSGAVARRDERVVTAPSINVNGEIPVMVKTFGDVMGLPEPVKGTVYLVSGLVLSAVADSRSDVFAPGEPVRETAYTAEQLAEIELAISLLDDETVRKQMIASVRTAQGRIIGAKGLSAGSAYIAPKPEPTPTETTDNAPEIPTSREELLAFLTTSQEVAKKNINRPYHFENSKMVYDTEAVPYPELPLEFQGKFASVQDALAHIREIVYPANPSLEAYRKYDKPTESSPRRAKLWGDGE